MMDHRESYIRFTKTRKNRGNRKCCFAFKNGIVCKYTKVEYELEYY